MRIVLAEDSVLLREGLAHLLTDAGHQVVAAVGDAGALLAAVATTTPDIVVADVRMPPTQTDKLDLPSEAGWNRRVLAILRYLDA
jgi:DNA-binding NarL/FixJ family response regulator